MWEVERKSERRRRRRRRRRTLTPDSECDVPLKVSVGEGGDVAGVAALV